MPHKDPEKRKAYVKQWCLENKEKIKKYRKDRPWLTSYNSAKERCNNEKNASYKYYGAKGIKLLMTAADFKKLWFQDKAYNLERPSIDRKKVKGNYEYSNCKFIEFLENSAKDKRRAVLQCDLNGNFIKEWESQIEANSCLKICNSSISACCNGKRKTAGGFIWRYKK